MISLNRGWGGSRGRRAVAPAAVVALLLCGCGGDGTPSGAGVTATGTATAADTATGTASGTLAVQDAWVRATDESMTAAFGVVRNDTTSDCTVVSAETSASEVTELHEVVTADGTTTMRPKEGGFAVPAGGALALEPGGPHVMLLELAAPLAAGDDVTVTLLCSDGRTVEAVAQVREAAAGGEEYHATPTAAPSAR